MKTNKKRQEKLIIGQWIKVLIVFISFFTLLISIKNIYSGFNISRNIDEIKYIYDISNLVDYKVYMYENSFFEEKYLGMNKQYTAKLVDKILIDMTSNLSISKISNIEYDYLVKATINGRYQADVNSLDTSLWTKEYSLVDLKRGINNQSNKVNINVPIEIDYSFYQDLVTEFQKQMRLDIDATLDIDLIINYKFYIDGDKVTRSESIKIKIPLSEPTFKIQTDYSEKTNEVIFYDLESKYNVTKIVGGITLLLGSILGGTFVILLLISDTKKTEYVIKLNKILKDYDDIIAETANLPDLDEQKILEIKDFIDLVDIEEELKIPIIYYEKRKNKEGWFLLIHDTHTYRFILKENGRKK